MRLQLVFAILLILCASSHALRNVPYGAVSDGTLDAVIEPATAEFESRTGTVWVDAQIMPEE
ncbi:hypothetical protein DRN67_03295, partial [Candidatus Micrarchaeota archaeon]